MREFEGWLDLALVMCVVLLRHCTSQGISTATRRRRHELAALMLIMIFDERLPLRPMLPNHSRIYLSSAANQYAGRAPFFRLTTLRHGQEACQTGQ
jgi:hypothetical protein